MMSSRSLQDLRTDMQEEFIRHEIESNRDYLVALRRHFHSHPELSRHEFETAKRIEQELESFGLSCTRVGETGVYSEIHGDNPEGRTIVLRCDIDALPIEEQTGCEFRSQNKGVMHACGHDSHTASLLGAAKFLASHTDMFSGTVRLNFQQAEEIGYGARLFVDGGYLDGADRTFGIHVAPEIDAGKVSLTPGPNNASVDWFRITVKGKTAHISTPQKGVDALFVASQIVVASQSIPSRLFSPVDSLLIGIGKLDSGTAYNIVSDHAEMEGTIRAMTADSRSRAKEALETISKSIAQSYGAEVSFEWKDFTSPLVNDEESSIEAKKVAARLLGSDNVITNRPISLGGDDFAEYIIKVPGVYGYVGSGSSKPETRLPLHNEKVELDEDCMVVAASLHVAYAINFLNGTIDRS